MAKRCSAAFAGCLALFASGVVRADEAGPSDVMSDIVYKGIVGKALDAVQMDSDHRLALQRTNAVVSNLAAGRSLSIWVGMTNPVLLIGGLVWGFIAASNIKPPSTTQSAASTLAASAGSAETEGRQCSGELLHERMFQAEESRVAAVVERVP